MSAPILRLAITVVVALIALATAGTAAATPALPSAAFDPNSTSWISLRDLTSAQFAERFDDLTAKDMMVIDLDVDVIDDQYRVGAVFRPNADHRGWASIRNLTHAEFSARWDDYRQRGYRLVDQETYVRDGERLYAGVWIENREQLGWASYRNVTSAEFSEKFAHYRDRGYLPVDVDTYRVGAGLRYAAVWVENSEDLAWRLLRGLTSDQYADAFHDYADDGLRSLAVESVRTDAGQRYAGIWIENRNGRGWYAYRDLTAKQYRNRWNQLSDMGYRLDGYEKYDTASGARYAGVWRQNSARPDWKLRGWVDSQVEDERNDHDVPGFSVAISHHGKLTYLRGFGYQDIDDGVWMHGRTVHRTASVSKAVAGVLGMRMDAKHAALSMDDDAREHLPQLPAHHSYTVGQTLMNRSCVDHYPDGFSSQNADHYTTALDAVEEFMDQPLSCTPGEYLYSTHAYTVFAAILEQLEAKPIDDIVLDELTNPFGLSTLRTENTAGGLEDRATLYTTDNDEYPGDDMTNKPLGGGIVSTALDLVRLGDGVLDGTILDDAQRTTMWTPIGSYAYGWDVGTGPGGERVVGKAGGQPGANAYLRIYPDDEIVIAVLSNRQNGGHSAGALSREIGEKMLAELP
jgi:CubicO group peptidase (beta-lactamase class C family)